MVRLSANLGFLWRDLPLPAAIAAAGRAGFDAVECHAPYDVDPTAVTAALRTAGLTMVSINTGPGAMPATQHGAAAVPGQETEARRLIDQAIDYATAIGAGQVHVLAGKADGDRAERTFANNLAYGTEQAAAQGIGILIEPINEGDMPGYFLSDLDLAARLVTDTRTQLGVDAIGIMFDCYHVAKIHGDVAQHHRAVAPLVGHVQFAAVPDRGEPDHGDVDYTTLLPQLTAAGYTGPFGAEYRPRAGVEAGLGWMASLQAPRR